MTDEEKRVAIAKLQGKDDLWTLMRRGAYYRPEAHGYTNNVQEAWIVTEEEANKHVNPRGDQPVTKHRAPLLDYLHDANAALELVQEMRNKDGWRSVTISDFGRANWQCMATNNKADYYGRGSTIQEAVCNCYLRTKGIES